MIGATGAASIVSVLLVFYRLLTTGHTLKTEQISNFSNSLSHLGCWSTLTSRASNGDLSRPGICGTRLAKV